MKRVRSTDYEDSNELKRKIVTLRVPELQNILGQYNISKTGRKTELQDRLISLIKNGSLMDLQRQKLIEKINELSSSFRQSPINMCSKVEVENKRLKTMPAEESTSSSLQAQPIVRLKKIPFYDHLDVLLEPSVLTASNNTASEQIKCFIFSLTGQQAIDIEKNRVIDASNVDYTVQVLFRICLVDPSEQNDLFPLNFQLRVNNRICPLPPFLPARPNTTPKRSSRPLNITPFVKISPVSSNIIEVRWHKEPQKNFAITCYLVRKLSSENLFERLKVQAESLTKDMIKEKLSKEFDSEIATTMLRVSLLCPLGKSRMNMPCRASTCKHLQCFDALLYLQMNECKQSWICPVCDKEALFENLSIDGYFMNVINSLGINDNEIQINKDGSWSKLEENVEQVQSDEGFVISDEEDTNNNKPNIIILKDEPKLVKMRKPMHISKKIKIVNSINVDDPDTIDLTLDD
jgi:E3 SUMO-protein ligase PIAS1/E3 SUMO-protein ligase PIAS2